ncbi:hypothetical protein B0J13DRAFT_609097 [Dactylonectria estremocensis]|uniref:Lysine-specific metallo-endopeptidase domain-containing protein n=1 Tax=Dactylonectria estremocensis TaxID=1079267 RepID=A0A9P9ELM8_9HYPO|nr:hypothetical protein B0J13DRAFT_609097 [Dactylonectria estremocensis]
MSLRKLSTVVSTALLLVGNTGANILWDPVGKTCDSIGQDLGQIDSDAAVAKLWGDVENLATYAFNRMESADSLKSTDPWEYLRVIGTFDTFFDLQHVEAATRWESVKTALSAMRTVSATDYVYMMCDDAYMFNTAADGSMTWNTPHDQTQNLPQSSSQITCAKGNSGSNLVAYRIGWPVRNAQYPAYVVMCAKYNSGDIYLDQLNFQAGHSLDDYTTLTTTLFHEFLHVLIPSMRGDTAGGTAAGGERYQVLGTQEVRSTYSPENPDSVTLFALALASDNFFWLTTKAESKLDVWNRFKSQGQVGENMIQALGLTQP